MAGRGRNRGRGACFLDALRRRRKARWDRPRLCTHTACCGWGALPRSPRGRAAGAGLTGIQATTLPCARVKEKGQLCAPRRPALTKEGEGGAVQGGRARQVQHHKAGMGGLWAARLPRPLQPLTDVLLDVLQGGFGWWREGWWGW